MSLVRHSIRPILIGSFLLLASATPGLAQDRQTPRPAAPVALDMPFPDDLTEAQEQQITALVETYRESATAAAEAAALNQQLHHAMLADAPDEQQIAQLQQQLVKAQATATSEMTALELEINQVFTAEQRQRLRGRLARQLTPATTTP